MLEGITVLDTQFVNIYAIPPIAFVFLSLCTCAFPIIFLYAILRTRSILSDKRKDINWKTISFFQYASLNKIKMILLLIVYILLSIISYICLSDGNGDAYTRYTVTISDEVKYNEFNDRYEVIDQNGELFTIRDKQY